MEPDTPFGARLLLYDTYFYYFTAPVALGLAVLAWRGPKRPSGLRWVAASLALIMAIPLVLAGMLLARDRYLNVRVLDRDETVSGVPLYAGSKIRFWNGTETIDSIELPRVTSIAGVFFTGTVRHRHGGDSPGIWLGTLLADQTIGGWPCRPSGIQVRFDGHLIRCQLASAHSFFDYELPAGTTVLFDSIDESWVFSLPPDKGLAIKALGATAPPGIGLEATNDGRLTAIIVREIPLRPTNIYLSNELIVGEIARPFPGQGKLTEGSKIRIGLLTGAVSPAPSE